MLIHPDYTNEGAAVLKALLQGSHGFCLGPRYRNTEHRRYSQKRKALRKEVRVTEYRRI